MNPVLPFLIAAFLHRDPVLVCAVYAEAEKQGLDPYVVCALVEVESEWNVWAYNRGGDYGLFQVSERWHGRYEQVQDNIRTGCSILAICIRKGSGNVAKGLSRYNTGSENKRGKAYAAKVLEVAGRTKQACMSRKYHMRVYPHCGVMDRWYSLDWVLWRKDEE